MADLSREPFRFFVYTIDGARYRGTVTISGGEPIVLLHEQKKFKDYWQDTRGDICSSVIIGKKLTIYPAQGKPYHSESIVAAFTDDDPKKVDFEDAKEKEERDPRWENQTLSVEAKLREILPVTKTAW